MNAQVGASTVTATVDKFPFLCAAHKPSTLASARTLCRCPYINVHVDAAP